MWLEIGKSFLFLAVELAVLFIGISYLIYLLMALVSFEKMEKYLFANRPLLGGLIALFMAFLTPFCSCSTIPVVVNMLQKKIRFGVVMVFLFASPVLDPTILTIMGVLLGWKVAIVYTVIVSLLSMVIGLMLERFGFEKSVRKVVMTGFKEKTRKLDWKAAWSETLELMKTVYPYLLLGAFIGAVMKDVVPTEWIASHLGGDKWWLVPVAALIGIPLYIRLATMIPISQILIAKGMGLGVVMAMMISSAGASLPEVALLNSIFEKKLVAAFVASVLVMASVSGFIFYLV